MDERQSLIYKLKYLLAVHEEKTKKYQEERNLGPEFGCITKEACIVTSLYMEMQRLGVTFEDCK